ncbi:SAV_915 family protein [Actinoplanes sp. DH11]|uniref:SAV_915 family protein n=1 Tax=Actinoplanes sp. DH11 TaxID=2857011 RepID=UPI001E475A77|nr:SAV_915 family protein [Actinoplanes sp. DH11]
MSEAERRDLPPYVYVPCSPVRDGDSDLSVDLRPTRDGRLALLVYSALDRLVDCCGAEQPWTVLPATELETVRQATGFELILMDVRIPEYLRRGAEGETR